MPDERNDTKNLISGYPTGVSYKYVAETFGDKLREQKLKEKQLFFSLLDVEFFKLKRTHREVNVDIKTSLYQGVCEHCNRNARRKINNYFVNVLETQQLSLLRWANKQFFVYPRFFSSNIKRCVDCSYSILENEEFREYFDQFLLDCDKHGLKYKCQTVTRQMLQAWAVRTSKNLSYSFSSIIFKTIAIGWYFISSRFMAKLIISPVEVNHLKELSRTKMPFVYILQSHDKFDWFKVLFLLVFSQLKSPVIFLPRVERPWLRWIFRKCGVTFFISNSEKTLKNAMQDELFILYVDENLKKNNHLMFYFNSSMEGDDKYLLDLIVDSIRRTSISDVMIVPTSICHETIENIEKPDSFNFSFMDLFKRKYSEREFVKVTFCQPYSLMDVIRSVGTKEEIQTYDPTKVKYDGHGDSLVCKIYSHLAYDFCKTRALTSTNIVSYLLLNMYREGVTFENLISGVDEFRSVLKSNDKPVAFSGSSNCVIRHALRLLAPRALILSSPSGSLIKPVLELPLVTEISYYANATLQFSMMDALIMRTIYILRKDQLEDASKDSNINVSFFCEEFKSTCLELCDILQFEAPLFKPCRPTDSQIEDALFKYFCNNYFTRVEKLMTVEEEWSRRIAKHLEGFESDDDEANDFDDFNDFNDDLEDDDDDFSYREPAPLPKNKGDEYQINHRDDPTVLYHIMFYKNIINYIIEAYLINAENLKELIGKPITDSAYFVNLKSEMTTMLAENKLEYPESISVYTLRNSMKLFITWGVVQSHLVDGIEVYYLTPDFDTEDKLLPVLEKIKKFR